MFLFLHSQRILRELQEEFQSVYPYLKMEFLWKHKTGEKPNPVPADQEVLLQLTDIASLQHQEMICIEDETRVREVEEKLKKDFGITVRFHHSTDAGWIPVGTHTATFGELNLQGRISFQRRHNISANPEHLL